MDKKKPEIIRFKNFEELRILLNGDKDMLCWEDYYDEMDKKLRKIYKHIKTTVERNGGDGDYDCCETIIQRKSDKKFFIGEFIDSRMNGLDEHGCGKPYFTEIEYHVRKKKPKVKKKLSDIVGDLESKTTSQKVIDILEECRTKLVYSGN